MYDLSLGMTMSSVRFSIRFKLIFSFFLLLLFIISGFSLFSYYRTVESLQDEIVKRGVAVTRTFTQMASTYIFESDYATVLDNARELVANSDIRSVIVMGEGGETWIGSDASLPPFTKMDAFYRDVIDTRSMRHREVSEGGLRMIEFVSPVVVLNKVPYLLRLEISLEVIEKRLEESTKEIILLSLVMMIIAVILGLLLSRRLTGPVDALVLGTGEISLGNLDVRIPVESNDEIGALARSFNRMTDTLQTESKERRQAEEALLRHSDRLEESVENRTEALREAVRKLENEISERKAAEKKRDLLETRLQRAGKMEAIGTLAGGVAHDLNNILSAIVTYPDLLLMQLPEESPLIQPVKAMQDSGLRAAAIVEDLLTLARRNIAGAEVEDLNVIIEESLGSPEFKKLMAAYPRVRVETDLEKELKSIAGSRFHLSKSLMNIISNGIEAMAEGGRLSIVTRNRCLDRPVNGYESVNVGDYAVLEVSDSGTGIDPAHIERIFEPFFTTKAMGKSGSGLGMAVVWGTVKDHNAYINVRSRQGLGTTFTLYFPVTDRRRGDAPVRASIAVLKGEGERILIVDDMAHQRDIATAILTQLDYRVTAVQSGEEALKYLSNRAADLVVLDMVMDPGMDGLTTFRRILRLNPQQKVIIVSGYSETQRVRSAMALGAGGYVKKPYMLENIASTIRKVLRAGTAISG